MAEYTNTGRYGEFIRIDGDMAGDVQIEWSYGHECSEITLPAADLLGWLRAQGRVLVSVEAALPFVEMGEDLAALGLPWSDEQQPLFNELRAALSTTATKEGESGEGK